MIRSFADRATERLFRDGVCPAHWRSIESVVLRKLDILDAATLLGDLRSLPGNRLDPLKGNRRGQYSVRINRQWRVCFRWTPEGPEAVEIEITIKEAIMARLRTHPGEVLREEYLVPLGLSARALAKELDVPANRLTEIMRGVRDVTADTAIRLGRYFGTDPRFWLNLQAAHDLSRAEKTHSYKKIVPRKAA